MDWHELVVNCSRYRLQRRLLIAVVNHHTHHAPVILADGLGNTTPRPLNEDVMAERDLAICHVRFLCGLERGVRYVGHV